MVAIATAKTKRVFAVLTWRCSLSVRSGLPHNYVSDLSGTGHALSCHPSSANLTMANVSQGGAAPVAATGPPLMLLIQKVPEPLEISWDAPWIISVTHTANWKPVIAVDAACISQKCDTSPLLLLPP